MEQGFSLIELLVTATLITIISSIAYPIYSSYLIRTHRIDGQSALLDLANRLERHYALNNTYETKPTDALNHRRSPAGWYQLSITDATDSSFIVQATPHGTQSTRDLDCQSLTFNHLGVKGITAGPSGEPSAKAAECWR